MSGRFAGRARGRGRRRGGGRGRRARCSRPRARDVRVSEARRRRRSSTRCRGSRRARHRAARGGGHDPSHLDGATLVVTGPGVPPDAPILGWARGARPPRLGRAGARGAAVRRPVPRRHRHERQDHHDRDDRGVPARRRPRRGRVRQHRPPVPRGGAWRARRAGRRGVVVPAAVRRDSFHPRVSVLLNLAPDHLDWHGSEAAYVDAKAPSCAHRARATSTSGTATTRRSAPCRPPPRARWSGSGSVSPATGEVGYDRRRRWCHGGRERSRSGRSTASEPDTGPTRPPPPRRRWRSASRPMRCAAASRPSRPSGIAATSSRVVDGVRFVDNSKATNVHAALAAIDAVVGHDAVLIAGGRAKGVDLSPLAHARRPAGGRSSRSASRRRRDRSGVRRAGPGRGRAGSIEDGDGRGVRARAAGRARCCSRPRAPAGTCSGTTPSAATASRPPPAR